MNLNPKLLLTIIIVLALFALAALGVGAYSISQAPEAIPMTGDNMAAALEAQSALAQAQAVARAHELELAQARNDSIRVQGQADNDRLRAEIDLTRTKADLEAQKAQGWITRMAIVGGTIVAVVAFVVLFAPRWMRASAEAEERKVRSQIILEHFALLPPEAQVGLIMPPGRVLPRLSLVTGKPVAGQILASPAQPTHAQTGNHQKWTEEDTAWEDFYAKVDGQYGK